MARALLTVDEYRLFVMSETAKNEEVYGNLYETLKKFNKVKKALHEEDLLSLDKSGMAALTINKETLKTNIMAEWYVESVSDEDHNMKIRCGLCNTPNKYIYYIRNKYNGNKLNVGSKCMTKFPNIEGVREGKKTLTERQKNDAIAKRNERFYEEFPYYEELIKEAREYYSKLPIVTKKDNYIELKNITMVLKYIKDAYVIKNKASFGNFGSCFDAFRDKSNRFELLKCDAERYIKKNENEPLICKKREVIWLEKNAPNALDIIINNNGFYSVEALQKLVSKEFLEEKINDILYKGNLSRYMYYGIGTHKIYFTAIPGYPAPNFQVEISFKDFMHFIGAEALVNPDYNFTDEIILKLSKVVNTEVNVDIILDNLVSNYTDNYRFLADERTGYIYLYRMDDRAVKKCSREAVCDIYYKGLYEKGVTGDKYLEKLTQKGWIDYDKQKRDGTADLIGKLLKRYR